MKQTKLGSFIEENRADMLINLTSTVRSIQKEMGFEPEEFTEDGSCGEPSIEIRLCIDLNRFNRSSRYRRESWIFRIGISDYDPFHSQFCGASCIGLDTDPKELLANLIDQVLEQEAMS